MSQNKYARELEKAVFNWYYCGKDKDITPLFNVIRTGMDNDMQLFVPRYETKQADDAPYDDEPTSENICHVAADEDGNYYIPVFTSAAEAEKGTKLRVERYPLDMIFEIAEKSSERCKGVAVDPWGRKLLLSRKKIQRIREFVPRTYIKLVHGNVVDMHADALVNETNSGLVGGGGFDDAIFDAAGPGIREACARQRSCDMGRAKLTGAYDIKYADYIIHAVGPVYCGIKDDAPLLRRCYRQILDLAYRSRCMSIVIPCISTGICGYPANEAANEAMRSMERWFYKHPGIVMNIYICSSDDKALDAYRDLIEKRQDIIRKTK